MARLKSNFSSLLSRLLKWCQRTTNALRTAGEGKLSRSFGDNKRRLANRTPTCKKACDKGRRHLRLSEKSSVVIIDGNWSLGIVSFEDCSSSFCFSEASSSLRPKAVINFDAALNIILFNC